nr:PREDICTED: uncharacterized protein LOC105667775 [Linepithema humile]
MKTSGMKTIVLAAWLLVIGEVYAVNDEIVQSFNDHLTKCEEELGKSLIAPKELRPDVIHCALKKHGTIDEQNVFDTNKSFTANCNGLVSDRAAEVQCKTILTSCIKIGFQYSESTYDTALNIIKCAVIKGIMSFMLGYPIIM